MDNLNHMKRIDGEANQRPFSESRRTVRGDRAVRRSAPERQMKNLTGTPDTASKDGRKASWVATREYTLVPMRDGSFLFFLTGLRRTMPTVLLHCTERLVPIGLRLRFVFYAGE